MPTRPLSSSSHYTYSVDPRRVSYSTYPSAVPQQQHSAHADPRYQLVTPSTSAASHYAPQYSAPAPQYSAPAPQYSAPAPQYEIRAPSTSAASHYAPQYSAPAPQYEIRAPSTSAASHYSPQPSSHHSGHGQQYEIRTPSHSGAGHQQQVYGKRVDTLGYGSKTPSKTSSSSLNRTFRIPKDMKADLQKIEASDKHIKLVQTIAQSDDPVWQEYGHGMCSGMSTEWIRLHSSLPSGEASRRFGHLLNEDPHGIADVQDRYDKLCDDVDRRIDAGASLIEQDRLNRAKRSAQAAGLPFIDRRKGDFTSSTSAARQLVRNMDEDGFYLIRLDGRDSSARHVMAAQISAETGEYKLMDPNSGEFSTNNRKSFFTLLEQNFHRMGYSKQFDALDVDQYATR